MVGDDGRRHVIKGKGEALTAAHEDLVCAILIAQLRSVALAWLKLDGNLLLVEQIGALEDDAEAAFANLLADAIVHAYDVGRGAAARHCGRCRWRVRVTGGVGS